MLTLLQDKMDTPLGPLWVLCDEQFNLRAVEWDEHRERMETLLDVHYRREGYQRVDCRNPGGLSSKLNDYFAGDSTPLDDGVCLTATLDILKAIAAGKGPKSAILTLGYSGWSPGQLESEIQANGWLHCPADKAIIFEPDLDVKYPRALAKIGIDPSHLVADAGHA